MARCAALALAFVLAACSSGGSASVTVRPKPTPLPALADAPTTVTMTWTPRAKRQSYKDSPNPASSLDALAADLSGGLGELVPSGGRPYVTRVIDGTSPPAAGPNAKRILRYAHLTDLQLADDESPTRVGLFDSADVTASALRPQDAFLCRMSNAAVRTINALHAKDRLAFTLLGGDTVDSAQSNELEWALGILSGSPSIACDSGDGDNIVPGPDNDGKDPFVAEGLSMPWKWVTGNHDVLVQGNLEIVDGRRAAVVGDVANAGTRDYRRGGAIVTGEIVADPKRRLLSRAELMARVAADNDGHGLGGAEKASGRATYAFDAEGSPVRFVVLDTAHEGGGDEGVVRQSEIDRVIRPLLDAAKAEGKWVILASHHATTSLSLGGGALGRLEADAVSPEQWTAFIGQYPNVLFSMVGHSHENRVRAITPISGQPWWEIGTAAIADYPHQFRIVELFDQDNGWIMLRAALVDFSVDGDPVAMDGRRRGVVDLTSGWLPMDGTGEANDRNVELWVRKP